VIPYDITPDDIEYYWGSSILFWPDKEELVPVTVARSNSDKYPYMLRRLGTNEKVSNVTTNTFVKRCLVHFPSLGYADLDGIPVFISPRAGANRTKGIDDGNLNMYLPIDVAKSINPVIRKLADKQRDALENGTVEIPKTEQQRYIHLRKLLQSYGVQELRRSQIHLRSFVKADQDRMLRQVVNKLYMSPRDAWEHIKNPTVAGVCINNDICWVRGTDNIHLYHRLTPVGTVKSHQRVVVRRSLSAPAKEVLGRTLPFNTIEL
jgi:hypothetical protein